MYDLSLVVAQMILQRVGTFYFQDQCSLIAVCTYLGAGKNYYCLFLIYCSSFLIYCSLFLIYYSFSYDSEKPRL